MICYSESWENLQAVLDVYLVCDIAHSAKAAKENSWLAVSKLLRKETEPEPDCQLAPERICRVLRMV